MNPQAPLKQAPRDSWRKSLPKCANMLLWLLFCAMSGTGLLIAYRLPPCPSGGRGRSVLGWSRHEWGDLHLWISIAFLVLILFHMALHWRWFWQIASKRRAWPLLAGITAGLLILLGILCLPVQRKKPEKNAKSFHTESHGQGRQFRGGRD